MEEMGDTQTNASASTDTSPFLPLSSEDDAEAHMQSLNNIFGEIFRTLNAQKNEIEKMNKEKQDMQKEYECKLNKSVHEIKALKEKLEQIKTSQSEIKSRMVTKSDILSQEIRINKMASKNDIDEVQIQMLDFAQKDQISTLEGNISTLPTKEDIERHFSEMMDRIAQVELQSQKRRDNYVLKEVQEFDTNEMRQSILELQTQSFNSIGALEEWREVLEEDLETIKVDLDSNIVRRNEWNKFVEHAEGFATGDITEQIMHDIRGSQSQIDKLVRDTKKIYDTQAKHGELIERKANMTDVEGVQEFNAITYATKEILSTKNKEFKEEAKSLKEKVAKNTRDIFAKVDRMEVDEQKEIILDVEDKIGDAIAELHDKAPLVDVTNLRVVIENMQHQISFIRDQVRGIKSGSGSMPDMDETVIAKNPAISRPNTARKAPASAPKNPSTTIRNTPPNTSRKTPPNVVRRNSPDLSRRGSPDMTIPPSTEAQPQVNVSTLKYQLENSKSSTNHLRAEHKKLEEELRQLKLQYEKERTKPKTDSDADNARSALLESSIEQCKDRIIVAKMRIKDQQEVINNIQQQIEQIALKTLQFASEENYETKEMIDPSGFDQEVNSSDTKAKNIMKEEKPPKEQKLREPKLARPYENLSNLTQRDIHVGEEEESFPAAGVRCLFCDRPANRISNNVAAAKPRKFNMYQKLRRPQTAREKMDRPTLHYSTNGRKNQHAVNIKVMDGVVAPPSSTRHSFRVSALVANPSKRAASKIRKRQTSNADKKYESNKK